MPVFTSSIELSDDYPSVEPSLKLNFAGSRALDPRITFTRSSVGTYVGKDGLVKTAGNNEPRFDHDPDTLESLGLLVEEQRANFALYSDDFGNAAWVKQTGHGQTSNTTISPDGTQNADTINRGATNQYIYQSIGITGSHVMSVWAKTPAGDGNKDFVMQHFNATDGALGATTFTATEQWQRFYMVAAPTVSGGWYPCIPVDLNQDFHVWGAQVEAGDFLTSYIPTTSAAVTRESDLATITAENFSGWFNPSESTLYASVSSRGSGGGGIVGIDNDSGTTYIDPIYTSTTITFYGSGSPGNAPRSNTGKDKVIQTWNDTGDIQTFTANGATVQSYTFSSAISPNLLSIGRYSFNTGNFLNGRVSEVRYYPKALTNAQLQLLTS